MKVDTKLFRDYEVLEAYVSQDKDDRVREGSTDLLVLRSVRSDA
jgi:hypothetical protein